MTDSILFNFPEIRVLKSNGPPSNPGVLVLLREAVPIPKDVDFFLRLQFLGSSEYYPDIDVQLDAHSEAEKLGPSTFSIQSPQGPLTIIFPPPHTLVPQNDPRIDEALRSADFQATWGVVIDSFEIELKKWITYKQVDEKSSGYPNEKGGLARDMSTPAYGSNSTAMMTYDPSNHQDNKEGRLVLIDEENGGEVGEVSGYQVHAIGVTPGSKDPVQIELPENGEGPVTVRPADYLTDSLHPSYANSTIVSTAATASRLIVTTSSYVANAIQSGADAYTRRTKPNEAPMTFNPNTHDRVRQIHTFSSNAARISAQTIGQVTKHAQNIGARIAGKNQDRPSRGKIENPGLLNKSLIAFSTIADGIDYASKTLLSTGANAATTVVGHKYGDEARAVAYGLTGSVRNVGLVYVDASGVSRRAIVRGVAKGMVIGKVRGGGDVVVPGQNDFITPGKQFEGAPQGWSSGSLPGSGKTTPGIAVNEVGFGNSAPPAYGSPHGTPGPSGYNQDGSPYFAPPPRSSTAPQFTGYGNMRSISPRPYEPVAYQSSSGNTPPPEKGPAPNQQGGYRY